MCNCDSDDNCNGMEDENWACIGTLGYGPVCDEGTWDWCAAPNGCGVVTGSCPNSRIIFDVVGNGPSRTSATQA